MWFSSWLRGLTARLENARPRHPRKQPRRSGRRTCRPRLEILEDRMAPAVLMVNSTADTANATDPYLTLREAIAIVNSPTLPSGLTSQITNQISGTLHGSASDTIEFDHASVDRPLTLGGTQLELSLPSTTAKITIDGGSAGITVDGNQESRVFQVDSGVRAEFASVTITGGRAPSSSSGGGALANGGTLTLSGCTLLGNAAAGVGGAVYNAGTLVVTGSSISGNSTDFSSGGGIFNTGTAKISGSSVSGNSAYQGGGIWNDVGGTLTVSGGALSGNTAQYEGGAIRNFGGAVTVSGCTVSGNFAGFRGIGLDTYGGTMCVLASSLSSNFFIPNSGFTPEEGTILYFNSNVTVRGCTLSGNDGGIIDGASFYPGFIGGSLTVSSCTLSGNFNSDGIIVARAATISDCTLSGNIHGITINSGTATISNCTLSGNSVAIETDSATTMISGCTMSGNVGGVVAIYNFGKMTVSNSTISGNIGGGIYNTGMMTLSDCTLSGNSAFQGGGIYNLNNGTMEVSNCTVSGNSAGNSGGGVFNLGALTIDGNSAVCDNQAPSGADVENVGVLSISHSAVVGVDNQYPGLTTINIAPTDTATALTASLNKQGQIVFTVKVLAAKTGQLIKVGTVTLYDGNNNQLGQATLGGTGQATFTAPAILASPSPIHAVYDNGGSSNFSGSSSASLIQTVDALTPVNLQPLVNSLAASPATAVALQAGDDASWQAALAAINTVTAPVVSGAPVPVTIVLNVGPGTYSDMTYSNSDPNVHFILNGSTVAGGTVVNGHSPALLVTAGDVTVLNVTFTTATDAPTILVSGGHLTLRNDIVQESTGYSDAAIAITGGSLDLGTADSPGGNTINVNGAGQVLLSTGLNLITAAGDTFQADGSAIFPAATTALVSSANPALPSQPITLTAAVAAPNATSASPAGSVTFVDLTVNTTLGVVSLSGGSASLTVASLALGSHTIAAVYSGDANYVTSSVTIVEKVRYGFSGFLAPLNANLAFALGRTVPIKFQLTDYNGFVNSLSAVTSLRVLSAQGTDVLTNAGSTTLRYDPTSNQFVVNWQTKGLTAGTYTVALQLVDGTTYQRAVQLAAPGGSASLVTDTSGNGGSTTAGALLAGAVELYVDNAAGNLTADELARVADAVGAVDALTEAYGVTITLVGDPSLANVIVDMKTTSAVGGYADGVLGCTTAAGEITLIQGWNWYAAAGTAPVPANAYDFQTVVTHELGHALGLGHRADPTSVMYSTLSAGTANRSLVAADLNVPDEDDGACGLHADLPPASTLLAIVNAVFGGGSSDVPAGHAALLAWPFGEAGNALRLGDGGKDVLSGGLDLILGGGVKTLDVVRDMLSSGAMSNDANDAAVSAILEEWLSTYVPTQRVAYRSDAVTTTDCANRHNDDSYLLPDAIAGNDPKWTEADDICSAVNQAGEHQLTGAPKGDTAM
jgi:hypothetical protein